MDCSMLNLEDDEVREEEEEETISLSDFPINGADESESHRDSGSSSELFEFFSDLTYEMSHADDIIFCGKLVPLREHPVSAIHHRRCESLSELGTPRTNSKKSGRGHSRSLDCGKFQRNPAGSGSSEADRMSTAAKADSPRLKIQKPRWYLMMFGHIKLPPEMGLRDIKNRQVRQNPLAVCFRCRTLLLRLDAMTGELLGIC